MITCEKLLISKVKGASLLIVLCVSLVCLILTLSFLVIFQYGQNELDSFLSKQRLQEQINEAVELLIKGDMLQQESGEFSIDLYGDNSTFVLGQINQWGNYKAIGINKINGKEVNRYFLAGSGYLDVDSIALTITSPLHELGIGAEVSIRGNLGVKANGIRPVDSENLPSSMDTFLKGSVVDVCKVEIDQIHLNGIDEGCITRPADGELLPGINIYNSFSNPTKYIVSKNSILIEDSIVGNVILTAEDSIVVTQNGYIENCILQAPKVIYRSRKQSCAQIFASDTILIGEKSNLYYPSCLFLKPKLVNMPLVHSIKVRDSAHVEAEIYAISSDNSIPTSNINITTSPTSFVTGLVYTTGYADLHGNVTGLVQASHILYSSSYGVREGLLHKLTIDRKGLNPYFMLGFLISRPSNKSNVSKKIVSWLN